MAQAPVTKVSWGGVGQEDEQETVIPEPRVRDDNHKDRSRARAGPRCLRRALPSVVAVTFPTFGSMLALDLL